MPQKKTTPKPELTKPDQIDRYPIERLFGMVIAAAVVMVVLYMTLKDKRISDIHVAVAFQVVLSIAMALLGMLLLGHLHVEYKTKRIFIRATGSMGLFFLTLFGAPRIWNDLPQPSELINVIFSQTINVSNGLGTAPSSDATVGNNLAAQNKKENDQQAALQHKDGESSTSPNSLRKSNPSQAENASPQADLRRQESGITSSANALQQGLKPVSDTNGDNREPLWVSVTEDAHLYDAYFSQDAQNCMATGGNLVTGTIISGPTDFPNAPSFYPEWLTVVKTDGKGNLIQVYIGKQNIQAPSTAIKTGTRVEICGGLAIGEKELNGVRSACPRRQQDLNGWLKVIYDGFQLGTNLVDNRQRCH